MARSKNDRRDFLKTAAGSAVALVASSTAPVVRAQQAEPASASAKAGVVDPGDNRYTRGMAEYVAQLRYEQIPAEVVDRWTALRATSTSGVPLRSASRSTSRRYVSRVAASISAYAPAGKEWIPPELPGALGGALFQMMVFSFQTVSATPLTS